MSTTIFQHKDGSPSSTKDTFGGISFTQYFDSPSSGGVTFKTGGFVSRLNLSGQSLCNGVKDSTGKTSFFSPSGLLSDKITPFQ